MRECGMCGGKIKKVKYAIRDTTYPESYNQWILRHLRGIVKNKLTKHPPPVLIPICKKCVGRLKYVRRMR